MGHPFKNMRFEADITVPFACTRGRASIPSGAGKLCSCSSDDQLVVSRRSYCCGLGASSSSAAETFLLSPPSHSLASLEATAQELIAVRNRIGPWQKPVPAHQGRSNAAHPAGQGGSITERQCLAVGEATSRQKENGPCILLCM